MEQKPLGLWEAELTGNLNIIIQSWFFFIEKIPTSEHDDNRDEHSVAGFGEVDFFTGQVTAGE